MKTVEIDKYTLATQLSVPLRDLRVLDPLFPTPYPSAIFIRDTSIICNLEHIKLIATSDQVWLIDTSNSHTYSREADHSLDSLKDALSVTLRAQNDPVVQSASKVDSDTHRHALYREFSERLSTENKGLTPELALSQLLSIDMELPYELRAIEAALHEFVRFLDDELCQLDENAEVALAALSAQVSRGTLERVRGIKSSMNSLYARVLKTREELERLLDDDDDMFAMFLSRKPPPTGDPVKAALVRSSPIGEGLEGSLELSDEVVSPRHIKSKYAKFGPSFNPHLPFNEVWEKRVSGSQGRPLGRITNANRRHSASHRSPI